MKPFQCLAVIVTLFAGLVFSGLDGSPDREAFGLAAAIREQPLCQGVCTVANLGGSLQRRALRLVLADSPNELDLLDSVFYYGPRLRDSLRELSSDPKVGETAKALLSLIGVPEDIRLVVRLAPPPRSGGFENRWAYGVACALLEPGTKEEWAFLRKAAMNEYDDRWVDAGAIQTLKLIASPRSRQVLEEAQRHNPKRAKLIARALEYIRAGPPPLMGEHLEALADRVAKALEIGKWIGNRNVRYNHAWDKALVDCKFITGDDRLTFTATFHRVGGVWKLRGVRETLQEMMLPLAAIPVKPPVLLPDPPMLPAEPPTPPSISPMHQPEEVPAGRLRAAPPPPR